MDAHDVDRLLAELCRDLGVCLPPQEIERFRASAPVDVDEFVDAVLVAEGLNPLTCWFRADMRDRVALAFARAE